MPDQCSTWCHFLPTSTGCAGASGDYKGIYLFIAMVSPGHFVKEGIYLSSPFLLYLSIKWSFKEYWERLSVSSLRLTYLLSTTRASFLSFHCTVLALALMFSAFTCSFPHGTFSNVFLYKVNPMDKISLSEKGSKQHDMLSLW